MIAANTDVGVLYGAFRLLQRLQTRQPIEDLSLVEAPRVRLRVLNHWDNLNRTVERGYAGFSLWDWHKLPDYLDPRYTDYARANASIGINGTVLTNVNANATSLTAEYLGKVAALADVFRPVRDPRLPDRPLQRADRDRRPEDGRPARPRGRGLVEAQGRRDLRLHPRLRRLPREGQLRGAARAAGLRAHPRGRRERAGRRARAARRHRDVAGLRLLARGARRPGQAGVQRVRAARRRFRPNVLVQVKNGPIDFQPREPFHPLFGAMPKTPLMMELQITQEYLGFATHLVYLAPLFEEVLRADTHARGDGLDGREGRSTAPCTATGRPASRASPTSGRTATGAARCSPARTGTRSDAWPGTTTLPSARIADEWIRMTFTNDAGVRRDR